MLTMMDGLPATSSQLAKSKNKDLLRPKICPNCDESNKPESKFCSKCKFVLTYDAFNETLESADKAKKELGEMKAEIERIERARNEDMQRNTEAIDRILAQQKRVSLPKLAADFRRIEPLLQQLTERAPPPPRDPVEKRRKKNKKKE